MAGRWGPEGPPQEAYSRVTNPQRFAPVVDAADDLVATLRRRYDVVARPVALEHALRAVRLEPAEGAPLIVGVTDFPGVRLHFGHWCTTNVPLCGCDACDEDAADAIAQLLEVVGDVVRGRFRERLTRHPCRLWHTMGSSSGWSLIDEEQYERYCEAAAPGEYAWSPWPVLPGPADD